MSVYKLTYGTPEKLTPTKFAPESKINVTEPPICEKLRESQLHFRRTEGGGRRA